MRLTSRSEWRTLRLAGFSVHPNTPRSACSICPHVELEQHRAAHVALALLLSALRAVRRWADSLAAELVAGATQRPLLSGYYRVAAVLLRLAEQGGIVSDGADGASTGDAAPEDVFAQVPRLRM